MAEHHEIMATHRRHEREKRDLRERHHHDHREMGHRHNKEEAELHEKHEAEMAAEAMEGGGAAPGGAPVAAGPEGGQAGATPAPVQGMAA